MKNAIKTAVIEFIKTDTAKVIGAVGSAGFCLATLGVAKMHLTNAVRLAAEVLR